MTELPANILKGEKISEKAVIAFNSLNSQLLAIWKNNVTYLKTYVQVIMIFYLISVYLGLNNVVL